MSIGLSERRQWVLQSEIRNMSIECERIGGINLAQGVCDTEVPLVVRRGAQKAMDEGVNTYTHYAGLMELRAAIAHMYQRTYGIDVDPENEIIASAGSTGVFYCACLALLDPGDEVILFEPYYGYHVQTLVATGCVPTYVRMQPPDWTFFLKDLEDAITPKTRGIMVNTPANPSGKVFTQDELKLIADFAERYDLFVFTDEIYEHFLYGDTKHIPPMTLPGIRERTITISGVSKSFSITGWRVGYCICDERWSQTIGYFNDLVYVCAPAPLQIGVAKGLVELGDDYYRKLSIEYAAKREKICSALDHAGLTPCIPQGAYYVLADISRLPGKDSKEKVMHLLERTGVACVPGNAFYHDASGEDLARFCFAKEDQVLDEACRRLEDL
ncbi:MAG TPA: pyridoxal phosphate-dependent aminotransferase [Syntrophorhabdus sp.]|nr:pyridoxal phosphate-dependent aminotransferase [Syntrophorhabdus sp.]